MSVYEELYDLSNIDNDKQTLNPSTLTALFPPEGNAMGTPALTGLVLTARWIKAKQPHSYMSYNN